MNRLTLACIVVAALALGFLWIERQTNSPVVEQPAPGEPVQPAVESPPQEMRPSASGRLQHSPLQIAAAANLEPSTPIRPATAAMLAETNSIREAAARLASAQVSFQEKQALWEQLGKRGQLAGIIGVLEQGAADHPAAAEYPAALGQAYLNKIPASRDARDPAILGLKADQCFDAALELDPSNWEARFFKAYSMSYWPTELNKTPEVIQQLNGLIEQQEKMVAQAHFSRTYALLGEQYKKAGYPDYARQVWQRGAALFPNDVTLKTQVANHP